MLLSLLWHKSSFNISRGSCIRRKTSKGRLRLIQRSAVQTRAKGDRGLTGQGCFCKTHLSGKAYQLADGFGGFPRFDLDFDFEAVTECFGITAQHRTLFPKMCGYFDDFLLNVQFLFGRNLRHMGDQSKRHAGDKIGQGSGGCAFTAGNVAALITDEGKHTPGFGLSGNDLLAPFFDRTGGGFNDNLALVIFTIFHRIPPAVVLVKQTIPRISL